MGGWDSNTTEREPNNAFQTWNMKSEGAALKLAPVQLGGKKFVPFAWNLKKRLVWTFGRDRRSSSHFRARRRQSRERQEGEWGRVVGWRGGEGDGWGMAEWF